MVSVRAFSTPASSSRSRSEFPKPLRVPEAAPSSRSRSEFPKPLRISETRYQVSENAKHRPDLKGHGFLRKKSLRAHFRSTGAKARLDPRALRGAEAPLFHGHA